MKKKSLLISLIPMLLLVSCGADQHGNYVNLTYGTEIEVTSDELQELTSDELNAKVEKNECFIIAAYQCQYSEDCFCWSTFKTGIANYINKYHEIVYIFNAQAQSDDLKNLNIKKINESTPMLYVFNGEQKIASYSYNKVNDKAIFNDTTGEAMYKALRKKVKAPQLYYVDTEHLDKKIDDKETMTVLFIRNACGDCKYVLPNVIIPYLRDKTYDKKIYLFDMQYYYDLENYPPISSVPYTSIKNYYKLTDSASPLYGYGKGVVPTIQYYEQGALKDASVYFNDEVSQKADGTYYISNSYYTTERLTSIKYANNVEHNVLMGMNLPNEDVLSYEGNFYWSQEKAAAYHTPLLKAFLDLYL